MSVRPGRLLPSVIVGALLARAMALGAGTASAEVACSVNGQIGVQLGNQCVNPLDSSDVYGVIETVTSELPDATDLPPQGDGTSGNSSQSPTAEELAEQRAAELRAQQAAQQRAADQRAAEQRAAEQRAAQQRAQQEAAQREAAAAAQRAAQAAAARNSANVLAPASAPGAGGLASNLPALGFGSPNAALLMAPLGSPLRSLATPDQGSPVTTSSDVQAMAFDNLPGGLGTPAVTGVLILSTFAAFALRHRVLRRARLAAIDDGAGADPEVDTEVETVETPVHQPA
jgi:hypothetical protein